MKRIGWFAVLLLVNIFALQAVAQRDSGLSKSELVRIKQRLLEMINQERRSAGLRAVEIDEFATRVAERHCLEMLQAGFTSHWNQAGFKPYMRYSQAGGNDAVMENVAGKWSNSGIDPDAVADLIEQMHQAMFRERPPNDGHRRNILQPQHTHLGLAISFNGNRVQLAEEFVSRFAELDSVPRRVKSGEKIMIKGELLYDKTDLHNIDVLYEPLPRPLSVDALNRTGDYSFPGERLTLRPVLAAGYSYSDGSTGVIDYDAASGRFSCPIDFHGARPGIYTIVIWVRHEGRNFPATNICIELR